MPLTVTALRSFLVFTLSIANAWVGQNRPTDSTMLVAASAIFRTRISLHWGAMEALAVLHAK
jgi:hypothetical protein